MKKSFRWFGLSEVEFVLRERFVYHLERYRLPAFVKSTPQDLRWIINYYYYQKENPHGPSLERFYVWGILNLIL